MTQYKIQKVDGVGNSRNYVFDAANDAAAIAEAARHSGCWVEVHDPQDREVFAGLVKSAVYGGAKTLS